MDLHKAIYSIHSNAKTISGDTEDTIVAKDENGNEITINWSSVNAWSDPEQYKIDRAKEYPSMSDQLDDIFHNGIDGWRSTIQAIKNKHPKPSEE